MGTIYKRGRIYWIRYRQNGKNLFESSGSKKWKAAAKLLQQREGAIADGKDPGRNYKKVTWFHLRQDIINDYEINGKRVDRLMNSLMHLDRHFLGFKGNQISTSEVKASGCVNNWSARSAGKDLIIRKNAPHVAMMI